MKNGKVVRNEEIQNLITGKSFADKIKSAFEKNKIVIKDTQKKG